MVNVPCDVRATSQPEAWSRAANFALEVRADTNRSMRSPAAVGKREHIRVGDNGARTCDAAPRNLEARPFDRRSPRIDAGNLARRAQPFRQHDQREAGAAADVDDPQVRSTPNAVEERVREGE